MVKKVSRYPYSNELFEGNKFLGHIKSRDTLEEVTLFLSSKATLWILELSCSRNKSQEMKVIKDQLESAFPPSDNKTENLGRMEEILYKPILNKEMHMYPHEPMDMYSLYIYHPSLL